MRYGTKAWIGLGIYLATVEALAPRGETLSERVDDWLLKHPGKGLTYLLVGVTAAHLLNMLHPRIDPIHILFASMKDTMTERDTLSDMGKRNRAA